MAEVLLFLDRLPKVTRGVDCSFSVRVNDNSEEIKKFGGISAVWVDMSIEDGSRIDLGIGRQVITPGVGGDTESNTVFSACEGGYWEGDVDRWVQEVEALFAGRWDLSFEDDFPDEDLPWNDDRPEN
jgi:hypothetical protein